MTRKAIKWNQDTHSAQILLFPDGSDPRGLRAVATGPACARPTPISDPVKTGAPEAPTCTGAAAGVPAEPEAHGTAPVPGASSPKKKKQRNSFVADRWLLKFANRAGPLDPQTDLVLADRRGKSSVGDDLLRQIFKRVGALESADAWEPSDAEVQAFATSLETILEDKGTFAAWVLKVIAERWAYFGVARSAAARVPNTVIGRGKTVTIDTADRYWTHASRLFQLWRHQFDRAPPLVVPLPVLAKTLGPKLYSDLIDALDRFTRHAPPFVRAAQLHDAYPSCDERDALLEALTTLPIKERHAHSARQLDRMMICSRIEQTMTCDIHGEISKKTLRCELWPCRHCRVNLLDYEADFVRTNYKEARYVIVDSLPVPDVVRTGETALSGDWLTRCRASAKDLRAQVLKQIPELSMRRFQTLNGMMFVLPASYKIDRAKIKTIDRLPEVAVKLGGPMPAKDRRRLTYVHLGTVARIREVTRDQLVQEIMSTKLTIWTRFEELLNRCLLKPGDVDAQKAVASFEFLRAEAMRTSVAGGGREGWKRLPWYSKDDRRAEAKANRKDDIQRGCCPIEVEKPNGTRAPCLRQARVMVQESRTKWFLASRSHSGFFSRQKLEEHWKASKIPAGTLPAPHAEHVELERMLA